MKKSILIIATALLSFLKINASNDNSNLSSLNRDSNITTDQLIQIFKWHVTTSHGNYPGTSDNATGASNMIALISTGEIILEKKIESYYIC